MKKKKNASEKPNWPKPLSLQRVQRLCELYKYVATAKDKRVSKKALMKHLAFEMGDDEKSERTISRDIRELRENFYINIEWDSSEQTYKLVPPEPDDIKPEPERLNGLLATTKSLSAIPELLRGYLRNHGIFHIEHAETLDRFFPLVTEIVHAINNGHLLDITHRTYAYEEPLLRRITPLMIVERAQRWYLIGEHEGDNGQAKLRSYGLDRITQAQPVETEAPVAARPEQVSQLLAQNLGVSELGRPAERLVLQFVPDQAPYERAYPWMPQFEVLQDDASGYTVAYSVVPNFELKARIRALGSRVQVVEPQWLRQEMAEELKAALAAYA